MVLAIILIIVGFALLIKGADFLVEGSSNIAKKFHIPEIIIGLTIVSIGTSMPEMFVSLTSGMAGYPDMSIGNVIGSNVCNLLLILGLSTIIRPVKFQKETRLIEIPMCLVITVLFMILCNMDEGLSRLDGIILLAVFIIFIAYTIFMGIKGEKFDSKDKDRKVETDTSNISIVKSIIYVILGIIGLKFGGDFTVNNAVIVAEHFNISEKIISLTILALGTSLPELVTSVTAAIKGNSDIAIGNIIGSNIFNMLFIMGTTSIIHNVTYNMEYNIDMIILLVGTVLLSLFPIIPPKNEMNRPNGVIYLLGFIGYLAILFCV